MDQKIEAGKAEERWDFVLRPRSHWYQVDIKGVWKYRDLVRLFVRRDFVAQYKQTILGPLWILIQPLLTTLMFSLIFSRFAKIPTGGVPPVLFYMTAFVPWTYFADCIQRTSSTFTANAGIFGKVYFPRLVTPVSVVISNLFKFMVQMGLVGLLFAFFIFARGTVVSTNYHVIFLPLLLIILAGMGLAIGLIVSSLTTRFRDLNFLVGFIIQLLMYGSSVIFTIDSDAIKEWQPILQWNPMVWLIEGFRYALLGTGIWSWGWIGYSAACMVVLLSLAIILFGRVEKTFMDTV